MITPQMTGNFTTEEIINIIDTLEGIYTRRTFEDLGAYWVLIRTIISQRTRDEYTDKATEKLRSTYPTIKDVADAPVDKISKAIHQAGFYNVKAGRIKEVSNIILNNYNGVVPESIDELIKLPGVGRKTANCVVVFGFRKPAIPVDVHVHRISNRLGLAHTDTPEQTEEVLRKIVPRDYWIAINDLMVQFGQTICRPVNPKHAMCPFTGICKFYNPQSH